MVSDRRELLVPVRVVLAQNGCGEHGQHMSVLILKPQLTVEPARIPAHKTLALCVDL